jgi:hypothetical protein
MTTKERILKDIKDHAMAHINEWSKVGTYVEDEIREQAMDIAGRRLQNLATAGTKAGDAEMATAIQIIEQMLAKGMAKELKIKYNF